MFIWVANIDQQCLTSFLKRLNFEAQQKQRLSITSHERGDSDLAAVVIADGYVQKIASMIII